MQLQCMKSWKPGGLGLIIIYTLTAFVFYFCPEKGQLERLSVDREEKCRRTQENGSRRKPRGPSSLSSHSVRSCLIYAGLISSVPTAADYYWDSPETKKNYWLDVGGSWVGGSVSPYHMEGSWKPRVSGEQRTAHRDSNKRAQ